MATSTGGTGLGTRAARWGLIAVWVLGIAHEALSNTLRPEHSAGFVLALTAVIALTRRGDRTLSRGEVAVVCASTLSTTLLALWFDPIEPDRWLILFSAYLLALLIARGSPVAGSVSAMALLAAVLIVRHLQNTPADVLAAVLGTPIVAFIVGWVWLTTLRRIVARERAHRTSVAAALRLSRLAHEAERQASADLRAIREDVAPLLQRISSGDVEVLRSSLISTEASVRDRIRSPEFAHPVVVRAVADCRARNVRVLLLGAESESTVNDTGDGLAASIASVLATVHQGSVTIRAVPAGRRAALSILVAGGAHSERVVLDREGNELERV